MSGGQHLVRDHADGPHVPSGIHVVARDLFRRHVFERADQQTCAAAGGGRLVQRQSRVEGLGETEVEHLRHDAARVTLEEDVLRLQVAVHETLAVGGAERRADSTQDVERFGRAERYAGGETLAQRVTLEQFHHQERPLIAIDAEIVDADDVRMGEAGGRTRFLPKAAAEVERSRRYPP